MRPTGQAGSTARTGKVWQHPARNASTAQEVGIRFEIEDSGTRVELTSDKWENWGKNAHRARRGYDMGWSYILNVWADRRTRKMVIVDGLTFILRGVEILRGGTKAAIARAGGELPR